MLLTLKINLFFVRHSKSFCMSLGLFGVFTREGDRGGLRWFQSILVGV